MSQRSEFSFSAEEFSGTVRLFPLPNLVLFPHVMQPLHIFERRYRDMVEAALAGDGLVAMAVLAPGWEKDYEGRPPVHPIACLGRITVHCRVAGGAYNLLLSGVKRVQLVRELSSKKAFREADAVLLEDEYPTDESGVGAGLHRRLRAAILRVLDNVSQAVEQMDHLLGSDLSLGAMTDIISYMIDIDLDAKMALLGETDVYPPCRATAGTAGGPGR